MHCNKELIIAEIPENRAISYQQPEEGLLNPSLFTITHRPTSVEVSGNEDIPTELVDLTSICLYRLFHLKVDIEDAFGMPIRVVELNSDDPDIVPTKGWRDESNKLVSQIKNLDDESIAAAVRLSGFSSYYFDHEITPDKLNIGTKSLANIRNLVSRIAEFSTSAGISVDPSVFYDLHWARSTRIFIPGVSNCFVAGDTFWQIKVFKPGRLLDKVKTLETLIYYKFISRQDEFSPMFKNVSKLGIFDARTNTTFVISLSDIPKNVFDVVADEVIKFHD